MLLKVIFFLFTLFILCYFDYTLCELKIYIYYHTEAVLDGFQLSNSYTYL